MTWIKSLIRQQGYTQEKLEGLFNQSITNKIGKKDSFKQVIVDNT